MTFVNGYGEGDYCEIAPRDGFGEGLLELGEANERIVVLTADLAESTRVQAFGSKFPERFFDLGVAEQNLIGVSAGLAHEGLIPFAASYAVFSPGRSWDQTRVSVCYSRNNVKIIGCHAGLSVGPDGATHQALEDVAIMRVLPNMTVVVPADSIEARKATLAVGAHVGPCYLRLGREKVPVISSENSPFEIGKAVTVRKGSDVCIIANGPMVFMAMKAAKKLESEVSIKIINMHTVKPLDEKSILTAANETGAIITAEDHQVNGGLGSAVAEFLGENLPVPFERVGVLDRFGESGTAAELMEHYGLDDQAIMDAIKRVMKRKNAS